MKKYINIIILISVITVVFVLLFINYGYKKTWELWNIPTAQPHFLDLRTLTEGSKAYHQGIDIMIENSKDPGKRPFNYPKIWTVLYHFGVNENSATVLGITIISLFLIGICLLFPELKLKHIPFIAGFLLSPALLLGIERANTDLLIFFLLALSVFLYNRNSLVSMSVGLFAFMLKLYPIVGFSIQFGKTKKMFIRNIIIAFIVFIVYMLLNYDDLRLIVLNTPKENYLSYGVNVLWMNLTNKSEVILKSVKYFLYLAAAAIVIFSILFRVVRKDKILNIDMKYLDQFRVGASVYVATFLMGNNWDYRLIFLLFTILQLLLWINSNEILLKKISIIILVCIYISIWHLIFVKLFSSFSWGYSFCLLLDECTNWIIFFGFTFLLVYTLPNWFQRGNEQ